MKFIVVTSQVIAVLLIFTVAINKLIIIIIIKQIFFYRVTLASLVFLDGKSMKTISFCDQAAKT